MGAILPSPFAGDGAAAASAEPFQHPAVSSQHRSPLPIASTRPANPTVGKPPIHKGFPGWAGWHGFRKQTLGLFRYSKQTDTKKP
jgi:hypothetical protein